MNLLLSYLLFLHTVLYFLIGHTMLQVSDQSRSHLNVLILCFQTKKQNNIILGFAICHLRRWVTYNVQQNLV